MDYNTRRQRIGCFIEKVELRKALIVAEEGT
jgi:hypothetical protein